jgi:two-component system response regulator BaeR
LPIIMVTARVDEIDRLLGLELGADDYVCKPFSPREVVARVKAVLRRAAPSWGPSANELELDEVTRMARYKGRKLGLTPVEFALLKTLAASPGRVYSRDQLMNQMYPDYRVVTDRAVDTHIKNLRGKLDQASGGRDLIESVYGVGYRLV